MRKIWILVLALPVAFFALGATSGGPKAVDCDAVATSCWWGAGAAALEESGYTGALTVVARGGGKSITSIGPGENAYLAWATGQSPAKTQSEILNTDGYSFTACINADVDQDDASTVSTVDATLYLAGWSTADPSDPLFGAAEVAVLDKDTPCVYSVPGGLIFFALGTPDGTPSHGLRVMVDR
jgi:hypothetical protein